MAILGLFKGKKITDLKLKDLEKERTRLEIAQRQLSNEINKRAQDGWRLTAVQAQKFWWFGIPWIVQRRAKLVYIFEREKPG